MLQRYGWPGNVREFQNIIERLHPLATPKLEFNGAFGDDNPFASDVRTFGNQGTSYAPFFFTSNRSAFGNVIFRPRSDLVMALEYRRLRTFTIYDTSYQAGQVNMSMGYCSESSYSDLG